MAIEFGKQALMIAKKRVYKPVKGTLYRRTEKQNCGDEAQWPMLNGYFSFSSNSIQLTSTGIVEDVLNLNTETAAFSLDDEQLSLDRMLRDLGCGDGTSETRREALGTARDIYERNLKRGLFRNLVGGQLVRLLLIQVQQLKVGLLSALFNIDTLVRSNRINFQLLATIPAVLLAWAVLKFLFRSIYHIRAKDLRPVTFVHSDMFEYLEKMESILMLNDPVRIPGDLASKNRRGGEDPSTSVVKTQPLGELALYMYRYLLQLNLSCPPFPSSHCERIHDWMVELLGPKLQAQDASRQVAWVQRIKRKHKDLLQYA